MIEHVFDAIVRERKYQDEKWGTLDDYRHEINDWIEIMRRELAEAVLEFEKPWLTASEGKEVISEALKEILQVIAVGVACLEQHGVFEREASQ